MSLWLQLLHTWLEGNNNHISCLAMHACTDLSKRRRVKRNKPKSCIVDIYQKVMGWGEERVTQMKLIGWWQQQCPHVHRKEVSAMTTSHSHSLEQASARNTHLKWWRGNVQCTTTFEKQWTIYNREEKP